MTGNEKGLCVFTRTGKETDVMRRGYIGGTINRVVEL